MNDLVKQKIIIVAGPTASGKTNFAIEFAKKINGELINADSRQIYNYLDIATNKGILAKTNQTIQLENIDYPIFAYELENSGIIGWLFNLINPDQYYNLAFFKKHALQVIADIHNRGKQPIIVGGTGLYLDSLINNYDIDSQLIEEKILDPVPNELPQLQEYVKQKYPLIWDTLNQSDQANPYRLQRVIIRDGLQKKKLRSNFDFEIYYPIYDREALFNKINARVVEMFKEGIVVETEKAIALGYRETFPMNSFGYAEIKKLINGEVTEEQCIELIQIKHRQYAKRQITWFEGEGRGYNLIKVNFTHHD